MWFSVSLCGVLYSGAEVSIHSGRKRVKTTWSCTVFESISVTDNGSLKLSHNHSYFYQLQGLLAITWCPWCDFLVWMPKGMSLECIYFDLVFWSLNYCVFVVKQSSWSWLFHDRPVAQWFTNWLNSGLLLIVPHTLARELLIILAKRFDHSAWSSSVAKYRSNSNLYASSSGMRKFQCN